MMYVLAGLAIAGALALLVASGAGSAIGLGEQQFAGLIGLLMIMVLLSSGAIRRFRGLGRALPAVAVWVGIFAIAVLGYSFRDEAAHLGSRLFGELVPGSAITSTDGQSVTIRRTRDGSFALNGEVNDRSIRMIFDTGASQVVLTRDDAARAGIDLNGLNYRVRVQTANGTGLAAPVRLGEIRVGSIVRENVSAFVAQQGALETSLLGMSFLETLSSYTVTGDSLRLDD